MFAILCRSRLSLRVPKNDGCLAAAFARSCSSGVCENDSEKSFTVSYLINACGLSSKDSIAASRNLFFKSTDKPDQVLKLLREYGFTDAHIPKLVKGWPRALSSCPEKTLLPKLEFFRSIGVPLPVLAHKLSLYPYVLHRSLKTSIMPMYDYLKGLLQTDERVVRVFTRSPMVFGWCWSEGVSSNISVLRKRGVPESGIVALVVNQPFLLILGKDKLAAYVDRAVEMGFDISRRAFISAVRVFVEITEPTLKRKMEVYRRCGWSDSDIRCAFLRYPQCMNISKDKIMANMNFLVSEFGCEAAAFAQRPVLLGLNLDKRMKPRCLVVRILIEKGLLKKTTSGMSTLLKMTEKEFVNRYVINYEKDIPEISDIYHASKI